MFWMPLLAGAALGGVKYAEDLRRASNARKAQGEIQKWSPWTGLQGQSVQDPSLMGELATGAAVGGMAANMMPAGGEALKSTGEFTASNGIAGASGAAGQAADGLNKGMFSLSSSSPNSWMNMYKLGGQMDSPFSLYSK